MSTPAFPTDFDVDTITAYAKSVAIIFGGFFIVGILLSIAMIGIFIKFCSKPKDSQEFQKKIHLIISVFIVLIAVAGCAAGWSYNKQCNDGVVGITHSVTTLLNGSDTMILSLDGTITNLANNLVDKVGETSQIDFNGILSPIGNVLTVIDNIQNTTNQMFDVTSGAIANVTEVKAELAYINQTASDAGLSNVPSPDEIPDINQSFNQSLETANENIDGMRDTVKDVQTSVNNTITTVKGELITSLNSDAASYRDKIDSMIGNFDSIRTNIESYESTYKDSYETPINYYSNVRTNVVTAILILPIVVTLMSAAAVFFSMPRLLKVTAALSFIFFFWYMLIAGVNYTLFVVTDGICSAQDTIVNSALSNMNENYTIPGTNTSFAIGAKVSQLIVCKGNNTLIAVFGADFIVDDLESSIENNVLNISQQVKSLDFQAQFQKAADELNGYINHTITLDFAQSKDLNLVMTKLENNQQQVNETINTTENYFEASLANVNSITMNATFNDDTPAPKVYYTASNVSSLDCNDLEWSNIKQHDQLCTYQNITFTYQKILVELDYVNSNITDIEAKVEGLQNDIVIANNTQNDLNQQSVQAGVILNSAYNASYTIYLQAEDLVNSLLNMISSGIDELVADTQCSFIGDSYNSVTNSLCKKLSPSLRVIAAMMVLGGASLFLTSILSVVTIYKLRGSGGEDLEDYS